MLRSRGRPATKSNARPHRATPARLRELRYRERAHVPSLAKRKRVRLICFFAFVIAFARVRPLATRHSRRAMLRCEPRRLHFPRSRRTRTHQTRLQERSFMFFLHVCNRHARVRSRYASQTDCGARGCVWCVLARGPSCVKTLPSVTRPSRTRHARQKPSLICCLKVPIRLWASPPRLAPGFDCGTSRPWAGPCPG